VGSADLLPPSPPGEKATARQDQAGKSSTGDGAGDEARSSSIADLDARSLGRTRCKVQVVLRIHYNARADRLIPGLTGVKWIVRRICECSKGPRCSIKTECNCNSTARGHPSRRERGIRNPAFASFGRASACKSDPTKSAAPNRRPGRGSDRSGLYFELYAGSTTKASIIFGRQPTEARAGTLHQPTPPITRMSGSTLNAVFFRKPAIS